MKCLVNTACVLSILIITSCAAPFFPAPFSASSSLQIGGGNKNSSGGLASLTNILSDIDLPAILKTVNSFVKVVGIFCPPLSQVLDNVIQNVTSTAFRVFGRIILRNGGLGGGGSGDSGQSVNVVLPTFPPDDDDYDDDDDNDDNDNENEEADNSKINGTSEAPDIDLRDISSSSAISSPITEANELVSPSNEENLIAKRHIRVTREAEEDDQDESESAPQPSADLSHLESEDTDRNKRFLPFGQGAHSGGSGNFFFDIIRLIAGSGATEDSDEKDNSPGGVAEVDVTAGKDHGDGYTEGIPGPITRLFVIANRGIANLVQDLILRLAQTSERLVNFKARLITSLI